MEILAEPGNGVHGCISDIAALGEHYVAQSWCDFHNLLDRGVGDARACREVKDA